MQSHKDILELHHLKGLVVIHTNIQNLQILTKQHQVAIVFTSFQQPGYVRISKLVTEVQNEENLSLHKIRVQQKKRNAVQCNFLGPHVFQYKSRPCKKISLTGWIVVLPDDPEHPNIFQLNDPDKGNPDYAISFTFLE